MTTKHEKVARPEFEEHDLSQSAKKMISAPLCPAIAQDRNKLPVNIGGTAAIQLDPTKTYRLTCTTNCYIAISEKNTVAATNADILLLAGSVTHLCLEKYSGWSWISVSGTAQLVELL